MKYLIEKSYLSNKFACWQVSLTEYNIAYIIWKEMKCYY
jgi:hypothetical protein